MPSFSVPSMSIDKFSNNTMISPGDEVVPILLVVDGDGKTASITGDTIKITDNSVVSITVSVDGSMKFQLTNAPANYVAGTTYHFDVTNVPDIHPFFISKMNNNDTTNKVSKKEGDVVIWTPSATGNFYVQCEVHANMGSDINPLVVV